MRPPSKTALFNAAKCWDVAAVKMFLTAAPELAEATDPRGHTALHVACAAKRRGQAGNNGIKTVTTSRPAGLGA